MELWQYDQMAGNKYMGQATLPLLKLLSSACHSVKVGGLFPSLSFYFVTVWSNLEPSGTFWNSLEHCVFLVEVFTI